MNLSKTEILVQRADRECIGKFIAVAGKGNLDLKEVLNCELKALAQISDIFGK